jgi:HSP20 family protein
MPAIYGAAASPFALMRRVSEDMNRLFETFGFGRTGLALAPPFGTDLDRDVWRGPSAFEQDVWVPQLETFQRGDKLVVRTDLPGLTKDNVDIEVNDGMLTISGERSEEQKEDVDNFYRTERSYGAFSRTIPLPEGVNEDQIDATFKDGVLEVTLPAPKQPERKVKQIPIR